MTTIRYGDGLIVTLNDAEAEGSGLSRQALASQYVKLLQEKLTLAREQHTPRYLWRAAIYAAVTMLIYLLVLWLIIAGTRWILRTVETSAKSAIQEHQDPAIGDRARCPAGSAGGLGCAPVAGSIDRDCHLHCPGKCI